MRFAFNTALIILVFSIGIGYFFDYQQFDISTLQSKVTSFLNNLNLNFNATTTVTTTTPPTQEPKMLRRTIIKSFLAIEKAEGAGARVRRSIGIPQLRNFSPFLMLDHFTIGPNAGFPDHPHRGQETITYLLSGSVDHEDFTGSSGTIHAGDLQFMTAGRGIVHAEMPGKPSSSSPNKEEEKNVGLQLWVDLPKELKYCEPRYRDLRSSEIPKVETSEGKVKIKIISGESQGVESVKDLAYTPVWILDVEIQPGGRLSQPLPKGWNSFMYILEGDVVIHHHQKDTTNQEDVNTRVKQYHNVVFSREGDGVDISVPAGESEKTARVVLVAGKVLEQSVVQYGPFVVNSEEEVYQAMKDYQGYTGGFERAKGWRSEIGKRMRG